MGKRKHPELLCIYCNCKKEYWCIRIDYLFVTEEKTTSRLREVDVWLFVASLVT